MFAVSTRHTEAGARRIASERRTTSRRDALIAASREWERRQAEAAQARRKEAFHREMEVLRIEQSVPKPRPATPFDARNLIARVACWHGYTLEDILGDCRARPLIQARFDAVAAVKTMHPDFSLPMLGRLFRRDHTTVLYALKQRGLK